MYQYSFKNTHNCLIIGGFSGQTRKMFIFSAPPPKKNKLYMQNAIYIDF